MLQPDRLRCLREVNVSKLVAVEPGTFYPFVDGALLTQTPGGAFASGDFNRVPVISGAITTNSGCSWPMTITFWELRW